MYNPLLRTDAAAGAGVVLSRPGVFTFRSVLKKHAAKRYMGEPPKERKLFKSSNLKGLYEFISDKPQLKKARKAFFNTMLLQSRTACGTSVDYNYQVFIKPGRAGSLFATTPKADKPA